MNERSFSDTGFEIPHAHEMRTKAESYFANHDEREYRAALDDVVTKIRQSADRGYRSTHKIVNESIIASKILNELHNFGYDVTIRHSEENPGVFNIVIKW